MSESVWDKADQASAASAAPAASQAGQGLMPQDGSGLGGGALFGGGGKRIPGLFNQTHPAGTVRGGKIVDVKDVHSRFHQREGGGLKYWPNGQNGKGVKPTDQAKDASGKDNRPVMDVHLILDTEYRLTEAEARRLEKSPEDVAADDGQRRYVVQDNKRTGAAIAEWNKANAGTDRAIGSPNDLIGRTFEAKRLAEPGETQDYAERFTG